MPGPICFHCGLLMKEVDGCVYSSSCQITLMWNSLAVLHSTVSVTLLLCGITDCNTGADVSPACTSKLKPASKPKRSCLIIRQNGVAEPLIPVPAVTIIFPPDCSRIVP